jgi:hypothetical protein
MIPALTIEARAGVVVVTMTADAAHVIGCLLSEGVDTWPEAAAALVAASNHASYTVPAHFVPREGSAPLPRPDYWSTSDARYGIGDGPRMTVPETGPATVHAPEGVAA